MSFRLINIGHNFNIPVNTYYLDTEADLENLPTNTPTGSIAYIIEEVEDGSKLYMLDSTGTWVAQ